MPRAQAGGCRYCYGIKGTGSHQGSRRHGAHGWQLCHDCQCSTHEGRQVYDNLKKTILFVIPSNIAQAMLIIIALLAGNLIHMTPVLILWMNMATSATLSFGLAFEAGEKTS